MELSDAVRRRRMVRAFAARPVEPALVDRLVDLARRAPSAGNTRPWAFVVLEGADTARLWDVTLPPARRASFRWQGLLAAPVVVVPLVEPAAYPRRYAEADKAATGLGSGVGAWGVPYWWVDGGMAVQTLLLAATDAGLGALFYGLFEHEAAALAALGVPEGWRALGAVALGWPAGEAGPPGRSAGRPAPPREAVVHRGGWSRQT
ncbi:MAG TPA: nitroreductase family protein [Acidimicrobiales bacterium]|nr:nitroreductase family protein [Acidimicrobiales bacterium]